MDTEKHYSTALDWESGLTVVTCNHCQESAFAGQRVNHRAECSERITQPRRRRIQSIKRDTGRAVIKCQGCAGQVDYVPLAQVKQQNGNYQNAGPALIHDPPMPSCRWFIETPSPQLIAFIQKEKQTMSLPTGETIAVILGPNTTVIMPLRDAFIEYLRLAAIVAGQTLAAAQPQISTAAANDYRIMVALATALGTLTPTIPDPGKPLREGLETALKLEKG